MAKKEKKVDLKEEGSVKKLSQEERCAQLKADGWQETPEIRLGVFKVFEKVADGVREYKEVL